MKYRKKPVVIEAVKWTGEKHREMFDFLTNNECKNEGIFTIGESFSINHSLGSGGLVIKTLEGNMFANIGDYIIKGVQGEFYPCKPDIFEQTYEGIGKQMNNADREWLEKCMAEPSKYTIWVDNDCINVEDVEKEETVHDFKEYGSDFIEQLLTYMGCKAERA